MFLRLRGIGLSKDNSLVTSAHITLTPLRCEGAEGGKCFVYNGVGDNTVV